MTRMVHPIALCLLAGILAGCASNTHALDKAQAQQRWNRVRGGVKLQLVEQQYQSGLFEDTVQTASETLALDPTQAKAYVLLARSYLELGKSGSARQTVEAARRAGLDNADLWYTEGVLLEQRGQTDAALDKYARARELDPTSVDSLVAQAECLVAADRATEALALLNREKDRVDDNGTIDVLAAHIAALIGDHREAIRHYRQALVEVGFDGVIAAELGVLLAQADRCDEALPILQPFLERLDDVPMEGAVRRALASCYLAADNARLAADSLAEYAKENPQDTLAQVLLAKAAIANGDVLTALRAIDAAEAVMPRDPEVKFVRAVIQWQRGELAAAATSLREVLDRAPDDVEARCLLAGVNLGQAEQGATERLPAHALQVGSSPSLATP